MEVHRVVQGVLHVVTLGALAAGALAVDACGGRGPAGDQTLVIATAADAETLVPPLVAGSTARQVTDQLFEPLADIGPALNTRGDAGFRPRLARRWTWAADSLSIAFALDAHARFHDGTPVRAADVQFTFDLYRDPALGSAAITSLAGIDSVTTRDSLTSVFWFHQRSPEQFYSAVVPLRILPAARLRGIAPATLRESAFARAPIGSGPFRFVSRTVGSRIELAANTTYHLGRPRLDRVVWSVTHDPATAVARLLSGDADVWEALRPEQLGAVARRPSVRAITYPGLYNGYLLFNLRDPASPHVRPHAILGDRTLRRALAAALDRRTMVRNVFDSLATVAYGPFARAQPSADTTITQPVYDPAAAARALDGLGWRLGPDGVRVRAGHRLTLSLIVPTSSQTRLRFAVLIQAQLRRIGVEVRVEPVEFVAYAERLRTHEFDAAMNGLLLEPSARGLREQWATGAADGSNFGRYMSPAFDAALDRALAAPTRAESAPWFHRAYQTIVDDAPAVWLFEPRTTLTLQRRVHVADVRPDAWWGGLERWAVDARP